MDRVRRLLDAKGIELRSGGAPPSGSAAGRTSKRALIVVTGLDRPGVAEGLPLLAEWLGAEFATIAVSVLDRGGLDELGRRTFEALDRIRVYTKKPGHDPDRKSPFSLPRGAKVGDLAEAIHKDLPGQMKCARIWGPSAFEGQTVQRDHVLAEGDVVEIHL
jgi:ribosome-interacting GTPase 1